MNGGRRGNEADFLTKRATVRLVTSAATIFQTRFEQRGYLFAAS